MTSSLRRTPMLAVLLLCAACACAAPAAERTNVVLCMADDQGWGDVGYNGHQVLKTPHMDDMAASGLRMDRFYAAGPVCSPTRASVMTGRTPNRGGCFRWGYPLRSEEITIAERLREAGYATGHFGKWHLGSVRGDSAFNPGASGFETWISAANFFDLDPILSREGRFERVEGESSHLTVDLALEFIRAQVAADRPFLAVVWFGSPHKPHRARPEDRAPYREHGKAADFYGEMAAMDEALGRLRAELRNLGVADDTLLWYCSDNGGLPEVGSTGGRDTKGSIYEGGLRVPGIVEWPSRIRAARATAAPASTSDILPTVLDALALPPVDRPLDGISLVDVFDGKRDRRDGGIGFWRYDAPGIFLDEQKHAERLLDAEPGKGPRDEPRLRAAAAPKRDHPAGTYPGHAAWLDWPWKLHRVEEGGRLAWELYRLDEDPIEADDLAAAESERVAAMRGELERWLDSVVASLRGADY